MANVLIVLLFLLVELLELQFRFLKESLNFVLVLDDCGCFDDVLELQLFKWVGLRLKVLRPLLNFLKYCLEPFHVEDQLHVAL